MKIDKLKKYETQTTGEPSPERIEQSKQEFVNLLTPMIEKLLRSPENIRPVSESFQELARQARSGIVRQPTIIQSGESENPVFKSGNITKIISGNDENSPEIITQIYTDEEKLILERLLKNE